MREIVLVRHGQASYGTSNYDQLSALGHAQMQRLGTYWSGVGRPVENLFTGPMKRHHQSTAALRESFDQLPEAEVSDAFSEFPAFEIVARHIHEVAARDEVVGAFVKKGGTLHLPPPVLMRVLAYWARGEIEPDGEDSFRVFQARVHAGLNEVGNHIADDTRAVIVTSGGPTAMAMMAALSLDAERALSLCFSIVNASFSVFRLFDDDQLRLFRFNAHPHLERDGEVTFI